MSKFLKKRSKKTGLSPGTLMHIGNHVEHSINIKVIDYDAHHVTIQDNATLESSLVYLDTPTSTWINISGIHDVEMIDTIGRHYNLHLLLLEDILNSGQRSKLDNYKDNIFIVMRLLKYNKEKNEVEDEQISLILGKNYLISFLERPTNVFDPVIQRLQKRNSRISAKGVDYLCYALIDCVVDNYFVILEQVDDRLEKLEQMLMNRHDTDILHDIQHTKRDIMLLRKSVWPMREVINSFSKLDSPLIDESTKVYLQDVYDHTIQAIDTIESFRDLASGLLEVYISKMNIRLNEIMKVLTVVATVFAPATFIASVYGMNFVYMPELQMRWGYPAVLLFMLFISSCMFYYFYRKKWL